MRNLHVGLGTCCWKGSKVLAAGKRNVSELDETVVEMELLILIHSKHRLLIAGHNLQFV